MSTSLYDLLPPNSTSLERDFSRVTSSLVRVGEPVPTIRTAKRVEIPDSVIPWLIYEYGLGELLPFILDQRHLVADGVLWQRIRGTPESVRVALGWINIQGVLEEPEGGSNRWAEYMLGLSAPTVGDDIIDRIVGVARVSSPVRSRLSRIYAVYDVRQFIWDEGFWDDQIWDDHSGVRLRPDWPQISYGQQLGGLAAENLVADVVSSLQEELPVWLVTASGFVWDKSAWDDEEITPFYPGVVSEQLGFSCRYEGQIWGPFGWRQETWSEVNVVVSGSVTTTSSGGGGVGSALLSTIPGTAQILDSSNLGTLWGVNSYNDADPMVLMVSFELFAPITIAAVGMYDHGQNGLAEAHGFSLWDSNTLTTIQLNGVNQVTIPAGTAATLQDSYRVVALSSPQTLQPGSYSMAVTMPTTGADAIAAILNGAGAWHPAMIDSQINNGTPTNAGFAYQYAAGSNPQVSFDILYDPDFPDFKGPAFLLLTGTPGVNTNWRTPIGPMLFVAL
jgi:P2-related tail formation protein